MATRIKWYKIAELEKITGVPRRTVHFYVQEELLHPPYKTGKTMAYYDEGHVAKLRYIARAKEKGGPLFSIREEIASIEEKDPMAFGRAAAGAIKPGRGKGGGGGSRLPRKERGKRTREAIVELGCELFLEKGYKEVKVSDVTRILGIGKGTFYFYFTDKKELFLEAVPRIFSRLFTTGWEKIRKETDPLGRLELRARTVLPFLPQFRAIVQLSKEAMDDPDPKLQKMGEDILLSIRSPLESDIEKGVALGIIRPVQVKVVAQMMIEAVESLPFLQGVDKGLSSPEVENAMFELIVEGIRKR